MSGVIELFPSLANLIFILRGWSFIGYAFSFDVQEYKYQYLYKIMCMCLKV
jgi:hypothetical protein